MGSAGEDVDVIIVGAGLSGLNSAYLLQTQIPDAKYVILEARDVLGGTWSFWKYPGVRSDSSAAVFRFPWHSWPHATNFADAASIQEYAVSAARAQGLDQHIRFRHRVGDRRWSSAAQMWTVDVTDEATQTTRPWRARWLVHCSGYYSYEKALKADIPGLHEQFRGEVVHPQFWPADVTVDGKNVVVIGSGATAVTILPHIARRAKHVTMLQRSPAYVLALPKRDKPTEMLQRWLPRRLADTLSWYRQLIVEQLFVLFMTRWPSVGRRLLRAQTRKLLPKDISVDVHFSPRYPPLDQRLCFCPSADFHKALRRPNCTIVTDTIDTVTATGIRLQQSGTELPADLIIPATGLHVELLNGRAPVVDGVPVDISTRYGWRGCMVEGVPNACIVFGYTTSTWMPGADAHFRTVLSVMKEMRRRGATSATPTIDPARRTDLPRLPSIPNGSGYLVRARDRLPISTGRYPWTTGLTYLYDAWYNLVGSPRDGMVYTVPDKKKV
ncbi:flavin-binding monooxygenase [Niveomyces insectorum RCEF 264]|uniref:Flavin-binding monooxygenase n=1 Tax=Niveomyces insectorum RCEF 264 TaxID=1081102 RepID=A0A167VQV0_9HYPO|nr:flavin-binding monooxygenase [Niveomyces insectorum RCEF 264]